MTKSALDPQVIANAVELACRAPSVHNSQPWHWVSEGPELKLFFEPRRVPHATDLSGREAVISCGAVLDHLRVAMRGGGLAGRHRPVPEPQRPRPSGDRRLRSDRVRHRRPPGPRRRDPAPAHRSAAVRGAAGVGRLSNRRCAATIDTDLAVLHVLADTVRPELAEASRLTESLRRYDTSYHAELQWWTSPFEVSDGVPYSTLVSASRTRPRRHRAHVPGRRARRPPPRGGPRPVHDPGVVHLLRQPQGCPRLRRGALRRAAGSHDGRAWPPAR